MAKFDRLNKGSIFREARNKVAGWNNQIAGQQIIGQTIIGQAQTPMGPMGQRVRRLRNRAAGLKNRAVRRAGRVGGRRW